MNNHNAEHITDGSCGPVCAPLRFPVGLRVLGHRQVYTMRAFIVALVLAALPCLLNAFQLHTLPRSGAKAVCSRQKRAALAPFTR